MAAELEERLASGRELLARNITNAAQLTEARRDYHSWHDYNVELLQRRFTTVAPADEYRQSIGYVGIADSSLREDLEDFERDVEYRLRKLESLKLRLPLIAEPPQNHARSTSRGAASSGTTVFIVHGQDDGRKQTVARFLEALLPSHPPVILHEQPNQGRTIIEKVEEHAGRAAFAVVLLTGDDEGRPAGEEAWKPRGRQNVILELGLFFGLLGRSRVVVLYEQGVERPSDIEGLLYVALDPAGGWRTELAKELKAVGLPIDPEALLH
jgi:predicted nucleotide-binding protein